MQFTLWEGIIVRQVKVSGELVNVHVLYPVWTEVMDVATAKGTFFFFLKY